MTTPDESAVRRHYRAIAEWVVDIMSFVFWFGLSVVFWRSCLYAPPPQGIDTIPAYVEPEIDFQALNRPTHERMAAKRYPGDLAKQRALIARWDSVARDNRCRLGPVPCIQQ